MRFANMDGRFSLITADRMVDVAQASKGSFGPDPIAMLEQWDRVTDWAREFADGGNPGQTASGDALPGGLGPPVPHPRQVFALALNYPLHTAEARLEAPSDPLVFTKFPACLTGPGATVKLPSDHVDWEVELVVVMGRGGHEISVDKAWSCVAGVMVGQDLSDRRVQLQGPRPQFSLGKSFPGFGPTGPVLVTLDELADPDDLELSCLLNEGQVQRARTSEMLFPVSEIIARVSRICPLLPGDLIFTGTPAGVGAGRTPPRYLRQGDVLVSRIEGVGELETRFVAGSRG